MMILVFLFILTSATNNCQHSKAILNSDDTMGPLAVKILSLESMENKLEVGEYLKPEL